MKTAARLNKISRLAYRRFTICKMMERPTLMTRSVPRARCLSSVGLNQKTLGVGRSM